MISANSPEEKACATALVAIANYCTSIAHDPTMTLDNKIKTLQWIYKKIPEINRLMIKINTKVIS